MPYILFPLTNRIF